MKIFKKILSCLIYTLKVKKECINTNVHSQTYVCVHSLVYHFKGEKKAWINACTCTHKSMSQCVCVCVMCVFVNVSIYAKRKPPTSFQKTLNI